MNSLERVLRAIEFRSPDRIPFCTSIDEDNDENIRTKGLVQSAYPSDILIVSDNRKRKTVGDRQIDDWGCVWETKGFTLGEVVDHPLKDWSDFAAFRDKAPDFKNPQLYQHIDQIREQHQDRYMLGGIGFMMMDILNFRGYENFMLDMLLEQDSLKELIDLIYETAYQRIEIYAQKGINGIIAWEDWGLQDRLMVSPQVWRDLFKDPMRKMIEAIHARGMHYILHSCGYISEILEDIIEVGVDVIQLDQQQNMGLDFLSQFKGRICFFCPVDIQLMSKGLTASEIEEYCTQLVHAVSTPEGGFMYKTYSQPRAIQIPAESVLAECASFRRVGQ